jgi:hypothetical protein
MMIHRYFALRCLECRSLLWGQIGLLFTTSPALAQASGGGQSWGISWAILLLCTFLGLTITLKSSRRTSEVKRPKTFD